MIYYEHARLQRKVDKILEKHSALRHHLKTVLMADLGSRYDMFFEDSNKHYLYIHISLRRPKRVPEFITYYENKGFKLIFHLLGDLTLRHELFFEKEVE